MISVTDFSQMIIQIILKPHNIYGFALDHDRLEIVLSQ